MAAKIKATGGALIITSNIKKEDYDVVARANPEALTLYEGTTENKYPVFSVGYREGEDKGSINSNGIIFNGTDEAGNLRVTVSIKDTAVETKKKNIKQDYLAPLTKLDALTAQIIAASAAIATATEATFAGMEVE